MHRRLHRSILPPGELPLPPRVTPDDLDGLIDGLRSGSVDDVPEHGTLALVRQSIPDGRGAGIHAPEDATEAPVWLARNETGEQV